MMDAKTYLRQLTRMDKRIDALFERRNRYKDLATRRTTVYRDMPGGGRRCASSCEEYVCKIVDLERELDRIIDEYVDLKREIEGLIARVPDERMRTLLELRYVNGWSWRRIAGKLGMPVNTVRGRLHEKALHCIDNKI